MLQKRPQKLSVTMKKFLLAFKKYLLGYLRSIAPFIPTAIAMGLTGYLAWYSPYQSQQQYIWFVVYSVVTASYRTWVDITENIITKALKDDKA
jgi:uncharacterized protein YqgC (DUF456 family)